MKPGDYFLMRYGRETREFYILQITNTDINATRRSWLVDPGIWISKQEFKDKCEIIGRGRKRWWRCFLPFIKHFIPVYTKPKELK